MRVALAQIAPRLLDRAETTERILAALDEAAADKAALVCFGETLLPGYPLWLSRTDGARFDDELQKELHARYLEQAVCVEDGDLAPIQAAADRVAGYFFSSSFVSAAAGLAKFISNHGTIRLLVGAQLTDADREALLGESNLDKILTQRLLEGVDLTADEVARRRYEVIAWLVRKGRLQIRVGVPCDDDGGRPVRTGALDGCSDLGIRVHRPLGEQAQ